MCDDNGDGQLSLEELTGHHQHLGSTWVSTRINDKKWRCNQQTQDCKKVWEQDHLSEDLCKQPFYGDILGKSSP